MMTKDSDHAYPRFQRTPEAVSGDALLGAGIKTWTEFFLQNPVNSEATKAVDVFLVSKEGLKHVATGAFARKTSFSPMFPALPAAHSSSTMLYGANGERLAAPQSLSDAGLQGSLPNNYQQAIQNYQQRLVHAYPQTEQILSQMQAMFDSAYMQAAAKHEREVLRLENLVNTLREDVAALTATNARQNEQIIFASQKAAEFEHKYNALQTEVKTRKEIEEEVIKELDKVKADEKKGLADGNSGNNIKEILAAMPAIAEMVKMFTASTSQQAAQQTAPAMPETFVPQAPPQTAAQQVAQQAAPRNVHPIIPPVASPQIAFQ